MGYVEKLLAQGEQVVFVTRRHWITLLPVILVDLGIVIVVIALSVAGTLLLQLPWSLLVLILLVVPLVHFLIRLAIWRGEQYIVTTRRVIDVRGILNKYVSDSSLEMVNDVVLQQSLLGRLLDYGDVRIITGSDIGADTFRRIAHPVHFKTQMLDQKERVALSGRDVPELLARLDQLRQAGTISEEEFEREKRELLERL